MYVQSPKWTFIFIGICVIFYLFQQLTNLWIYLAFFPAFALQYPWMFLTSIFLHATFSHLFFNMLALFFFGIYLERTIGRRAFVIMFFLSGIVGNGGYMITASNPLTPSVGASGAIYGIIGTLATIVPFTIVFFGFVPLPMIVAAVLWALVDLVGLFGPSGIAHGAHLAGLFVGVAFGIYLRLRTGKMSEIESRFLGLR